MEKKNMDKLKQLYENGYKCIKYEDNSDGELKAYFKNFEEEKIEELVSYDESEITQIKNYVDNY